MRDAILFKGAGLCCLFISLFTLPGPGWSEELALVGARQVQMSRQRTLTGAWGQLTIKDIMLEPDASIVEATQPSTQQNVWYFGGRNRDTLAYFFTEAGLHPVFAEQLLRSVQPAQDGQGLLVYPPDDIILRISSTTRQNLYHELARFKQNRLYRDPYWMPADKVTYWLDPRMLNEQIMGNLQDLMYLHDKYWLMSDPDLLLRHLPGPDDRTQVLRVLMRHNSLNGMLALPPDQSLKEVIQYWRYPPGLAEDANKLADRLAQVQADQSTIPLADLLPPMPREVLHRFAIKSGDHVLDCHWTTFNFFDTQLTDFSVSPEDIRPLLVSRYVNVTNQPAFGDVVLLRNDRDAVVHSCNYLAAGLVFTKNGCSGQRPWTIMKLDDVRALYALHDPVAVYFMRRKDLAQPQGDAQKDISSQQHQSGG